MKREIAGVSHRNLAGLMIALLLALAACGGGGGGDHGGGGLATAFTKKAEAAGAAGIAGGLFSTAPELRYQFLLIAADIKGSGRIKSVGFRYAADLVSALSCPNTTIRMGATTVGTLAMTYDSNVNQGAGSAVIVLSNATVSIPAGTNGNYFNIDLATPFEYNGKDNLVVEVTRTSACTGQISVQLPTPTVAYNGLVFLAAAGASTAVDGSPFVGAAHMQFAFTAGDNRIDYAGLGNNYFPFGNNLRNQYLFLASEINGSGPITGIAFQRLEISVAGTYTYTLRLGHSTLAALTTTFADNYSAPPTTVGNAVNFTIPAGIPVDGWTWVPIPDGVFTYNGTDNLIIDVTTTAASVNNSALRVASIAGRRAVAVDAAAATALVVDDTAHHIALRFGGHVVLMSPGSDSFDSIPFTGAGSSKRQYLYRTAELGTGGSITSVACRLDQGAVGTTLATAYTNFEVVLGHTMADALVATFALNMTDATTVFSGTYNLAAGLRGGDWIAIPLSTPFAYDPARNLVVQLSGDGGANAYNCDARGDATLYANRHAFAFDRTAAGGSTNSFQNELRLTINK